MGWSAGLEEVSWAKVLATGPRQHANSMCWEFPPNFWEIWDELGSCDFPAQVRCELFLSREVFAGWAVGTVCLGQPHPAGGFGGGMEQVMETGLLSPFPRLLLLPISPFRAVPTEHKTSRSEAVSPAPFAMAKGALKRVQRQVFF